MEIPTLVDEYTFNECLIPFAKKLKSGDVFVEVGSFLGGSLCEVCPHITRGVEVYAIDNWLCNNISQQSREWAGVFTEFYVKFWANMCACGLNDIVKPISKDSIEAAKDFYDKSIDLLFLDGDHSYPYVTQEIRAWLPKMKTNGIIVGHDYCSADGIRLAVQENFGLNFKLNSRQTAYIVELGKGLN